MKPQRVWEKINLIMIWFPVLIWLMQTKLYLVEAFKWPSNTAGPFPWPQQGSWVMGLKVFFLVFSPPSLGSAYESERFVPWRNNINKSCDKMTFLKSRFGWKILFTAVSLLWLQMPVRVELLQARTEVWHPLNPILEKLNSTHFLFAFFFFFQFENPYCQWTGMCTNNSLIFALPHCFWREASGSGRGARAEDLETDCLLIYRICLLAWWRGPVVLPWELLTPVACEEGSGLGSDTGIFPFCCSFH